jgi:hypothetical protein
MDKLNLTPGTPVTYDGRANGPQVGIIEEREVVASYYPGGADIVFYAITGAGVLIPAADIIASGPAWLRETLADEAPEAEAVLNDDAEPEHSAEYLISALVAGADLMGTDLASALDLSDDEVAALRWYAADID